MFVLFYFSYFCVVVGVEWQGNEKGNCLVCNFLDRFVHRHMWYLLANQWWKLILKILLRLKSGSLGVPLYLKMIFST